MNFRLKRLTVTGSMGVIIVLPNILYHFTLFARYELKNITSKATVGSIMSTRNFFPLTTIILPAGFDYKELIANRR